VVPDSGHPRTNPVASRSSGDSAPTSLPNSQLAESTGTPGFLLRLAAPLFVATQHLEGLTQLAAFVGEFVRRSAIEFEHFEMGTV